MRSFGVFHTRGKTRRGLLVTAVIMCLSMPLSANAGEALAEQGDVRSRCAEAVCDIISASFDVTGRCLSEVGHSAVAGMMDDAASSIGVIREKANQDIKDDTLSSIRSVAVEDNVAMQDAYARNAERAYEENERMSLQHDVAWLAVQMAAVASDQDTPLRQPSAYPWAKIDDPRLYNEYAIMDATLGKYGGNNAYASCNQAACGVIAAVFDMSVIPHGNGSEGPKALRAWMDAHPETYEHVIGATFDDLEPGDILSADNANHTAIYVGNELAQQKFPGTSGVVYQARYSEGKHAIYPAIEPLSSSDFDYLGYQVYRCVQRNSSSGYEQIDYRALIS